MTRAPRLALGVVRGRRFGHDPDGHNALVLLSGAAGALLDSADGRTLGELVATLSGGHAGREAMLLKQVPLLLKSGLLRSPGVTPRGPAKAAGRTFQLWLHLTNACNLDCPYCYIDKSKTKLGVGVEQAMVGSIERTAQSGLYTGIHARFAGGEPMLQFGALKRVYGEATTRCARHDVRFSAAILTNGTVVPDGAPEWVATHGLGLSVSVDGLGEVQDRMRPRMGGGGSFKLLQAGLAKWRSAGLRPYMLLTVGDSNLDELPELTAWLLSEGLPFRYSLVRDLQWGATDLADQRGAQRCGDMRPDSFDAGILGGAALDRVRGTFHRCYDLIEAHVGAQVDAQRPVVPPFRQTHHFCDLSLWRPIAKACGAGNNYLAIGDGGALSPCQAALHDAEAGRLRADVPLHTQMAETRPFGAFTRSVGNDTCNRCRHKPSCAGGCPLLLHRREGHIDGRSPYCEVFRAVIPRIVRIAALEQLGRWQQAQRDQAASL
ncbi:MAG: radical SAM protein [Myxococcales bacterium]|nr:radical SAM protein [Myxococcales bacterium]